MFGGFYTPDQFVDKKRKFTEEEWPWPYSMNSLPLTINYKARAINAAIQIPIIALIYWIFI